MSTHPTPSPKCNPVSYGRLRPMGRPVSKPSQRWWVVLLGAATFLVASSSVLAVAIVKANGSQRRSSVVRPTKAINRACGRTQYHALCVQSLVGYPGALTASKEEELVPISVNVSLHRFGQALSLSAEMANWQMDSIQRSAYEDCIELLDHSVELLARSLLSVTAAGGGGGATNEDGGGSTEDVVTWLSAALTNQDTCTEGLMLAGGALKAQMLDRLKDLLELVSNALAIYAATYNGVVGSGDFSGLPIRNNRKLISTRFPAWVSRSDRELLESTTPTIQIQANVVVSLGGETGTVKTIQEAIHMVPEQSSQRFIIYVKAGRYEEIDLKVGRKKTNVWFIGDGRGKTVISGVKSVAHDNITTFHTASFAATGTGFVAKDISFVNDAGPGNHQAVALRVGADHTVIFRCEIKGYQDTLYTHSQRQFYRECDIYGTVDFIFGNAAVVFQHCNMWARKPMPMQKVTITAQNRKDPNQNTGMSIHACKMLATSDLQPVKASYPTFLGRPWKVYSRVVYMMSSLGDHIHPRGWLEWNSTSPVDTLYYGEFMNIGPCADTSARVKWPGLHVNMTKDEALKFTVDQFIYGSAWLTPTGVGFQAGLTA